MPWVYENGRFFYQDDPAPADQPPAGPTITGGPPQEQQGRQGPPVGGYGGLGGYGPPAGGYQQGRPFTTGYGGSKPGWDPRDTFAKVGQGTPGMSQQDLAALQWAFDQASQAFEQGQGRLREGQFLGGTLGQGAQQRFLSPTGMDPAVLEALKAELAQTFAGSRQDQLAQAEARGTAAGFGGSAGLQRQLSDIEAQSTQDLVSQLANLAYQNEQFKLAQSGQAAPLAGQLAALEAALAQASAQGYFQRQFPAVPGLDGEGGGAGFQYLNERGEIMPRQGWTQADWEAALAERERFLRQQGRAA